MSHHGIGLLFTPGPGGRPQVLWIGDVEVWCAACGFAQFARWYGNTSWHALTTARLRHELDALPQRVSGQCEQCEAVYGPSEAARYVLHYGLPGLRGRITGFATREGQRRWMLAPHRRMDVQLVPEWSPDIDRSNLEVDVLDEDAARRAFGRALSAKAVVRDAVRNWDGDARILALAPGLAAVLGEGDVGDLAARVPDHIAGAERVVRPLVVDGVPVDGYPGAPGEWLRGLAIDEDLTVVGVADPDPVRPAIERVIATFPIEVTLDAPTPDVVRLIAPDDTERDAPLDIHRSDVAAEAAGTLVPPEEAAHLEVERILHALTGLVADEVSATEDAADAGDA